jgi:hypothetical protein
MPPWAVKAVTFVLGASTVLFVLGALIRQGIALLREVRQQLRRLHSSSDAPSDVSRSHPDECPGATEEEGRAGG